jgi:hypothetical protein
MIVPGADDLPVDLRQHARVMPFRRGPKSKSAPKDDKRPVAVYAPGRIDEAAAFIPFRRAVLAFVRADRAS